ncbi:Ferri-bacillibactin esterase BesA [compost metagenome]
MKKIVLAIILLCALPKTFGQETKPFVLGNIVEIQSKELSEKRILNIYLPDGYNQNDTIKYPVIYLLDGSADEDFIHVTGLVQFLSYSWINIVPKSIVVGIANVDRKRDFTYPTTVEKDKKDFPTTGSSAKFISFLENELQPFIEKKYNTSSSKTIIGQSLGGLLATEILFKKPELFSKYIIVSPSLWWDNESLLNNPELAFKQKSGSKKMVYVGVGNEHKVMIKDAKRLAKFLKNYKKDIDVVYDFFDKEDHGTILHQAVYNAFREFNKLK